MKRLFFTLSVLVLLSANHALAVRIRPSHGHTTRTKADAAPSINILSIIPAQGEPGISVTLYGTGFTEKTVAFLGDQEVPTAVLGPKQLSFEIPKLAPGLYALFLKREDGVTSKIYNFNIIPLKPVATSLDPDRIDACSSGRDREVAVSGRNFQDSSQVLFDGAAIRSRYLTENSISFTAPQVAPGLHRIQVKNQEDAISGALGLFINAKPEIDSVSQGEEYVNSYNLVINGRNFQQGAAVVVTEEKSIEQSGGQYSATTKRLVTGASNATERESAIYVNCNQIIYQRFPYSTTLKNFSLQVVNPNGEESTAASVSAP